MKRYQINVDGKGYHFTIKSGTDGYTAQCIEIPQAIGEGIYAPDAETNLADAIRAVVKYNASSAQ